MGGGAYPPWGCGGAGRVGWGERGIVKEKRDKLRQKPNKNNPTETYYFALFTQISRKKKTQRGDAFGPEKTKREYGDGGG